MIKKAKKKPIVIEFIQYNGNTNKKDIEDWIGKDLRCEVFSDSAYEADMGMPYFSLFIPTLEGEMRADPHDYIIKGVRGEFYPCKPDVFEKTYDVIEEENKELKIQNTNSNLKGLEVQVAKDSHRDRANKTQDQLTKAKELIKKLYSHVFQGMGFMEINDYNVQKAEAEQFLKE